MTPEQKGRVLEEATAAIEGAIGKSLNLGEHSFSIETRKIVSVHGVSHEFDIYVEVDLGHEYRSIFVFECKNWSTPVGKNEAIVFSEKVRAVSAQRGFLVAEVLTEDASNQLAQDSRLHFLPATALPAESLQHLVDFEVVGIDQRLAELEFVRSSTMPGRDEVSAGESFMTLHGQPVNIMDFANRWIVEVIREQTPGIMSDRTAQNNYRLDAIRRFEGELTLNGTDIQEVRLQVEYSLVRRRPRILSSFDIRTRGRAAVLEPITLPGGATVRMAIAQLPERNVG